MNPGLRNLLMLLFLGLPAAALWGAGMLAVVTAVTWGGKRPIRSSFYSGRQHRRSGGCFPPLPFQ
jgi:hypothetical protein